MPATPDPVEAGNVKATADPELLSLLMPLHYFYARDGLDLPGVELLAGEALPEPQRSLLYHEADMTSTLARHHGARIMLEVRAAEVSEDYVMRMVILRRSDTNAPVEFGAIGIRLEVFEEPLRSAIASGSAPLGGLLERHHTEYRSAPKAYFSLAADARIAGALDEAEGSQLYGRCNALTDSDGIVFADIVEVLPQAQG